MLHNRESSALQYAKSCIAAGYGAAGDRARSRRKARDECTTGPGSGCTTSGDGSRSASRREARLCIAPSYGTPVKIVFGAKFLKGEALNLARSQTLRRGLHPSNTIAGYTVSPIDTQPEPPYLAVLKTPSGEYRRRLNRVRKMNEKPFAFTIASACRVSALGRTTLYAALKSGALSARKCGRRTLILAADLEKFLDNLPSAREFPKGVGAGGQVRLNGDER